jgi:hypothetical protein
MTDSRLDFRISHGISQGINFCFYLLGKGQLRLPALARPALWPAPDADPFADFAGRFETAEAGGLDARQVDPLWRSWLRAVARTCPDSAADALSAMPDLPARPQVRTEFQRFGRMYLNDFLERWTGILLDLDGRLQKAVRSFDSGRILARHQEALGVEFRPGRAGCHYHLLRIFSVNRFGTAFVLGAGYLDRPDRLADAIGHETLHVLVGQMEAWQRDEIRPLLSSLEPLLEQTHLRPADAVEEVVCLLMGVLEREGEAVPLERVEARIPQPPLRVIAKALYEHRRTRHTQGFTQWLAASLQQAGRARRGV